jgi:3-deoxy-D-manno-octulosonic acid kinase
MRARCSMADGVEVAQRGRGAIRIVDSALGRVVVRHYRRGGFAARISRDWFLWTGADATRPLREFRITRKLHALGLPVVEAIAARYLRVGMGYRADLATLLLADTQTLAERLRQRDSSRRGSAGPRSAACSRAFTRTACGMPT